MRNHSYLAYSCKGLRLLNKPETVSEAGKRAADAYRRVLDLPHVFGVKIITPKEFIAMPTDRPMKFAIWVRSKTPVGTSNVRNIRAE